jgi:hypothetical protein
MDETYIMETMGWISIATIFWVVFQLLEYLFNIVQHLLIILNVDMQFNDILTSRANNIVTVRPGKLYATAIVDYYIGKAMLIQLLLHEKKAFLPKDLQVPLLEALKISVAPNHSLASFNHCVKLSKYNDD